MDRKNTWIILAVVAVLVVLTFLFFLPSNNDLLENGEPNITVDRSRINANTIALSQVVAEDDGWVAVHEISSSGLGEVIGVSRVSNGVSEDIVIALNHTPSTDLAIVLYSENGNNTEFEPFENNQPVAVNGIVVAELVPLEEVMNGENNSNEKDTEMNTSLNNDSENEPNQSANSTDNNFSVGTIQLINNGTNLTD